MSSDSRNTRDSLVPRVSAIIINWNSAPLLKRCLESLRADPDVGDWQVIVVDNASDEDPSPMIRETLPAAEIARPETNLGFSGGNNLGARQAGGEYLLFLNADTEVVPGAIRGLATFLDEHPDAGAVGPRLVGADGSVQVSAGVFPGPWQYLSSSLHLARVSVPDSVGPVDYVAGAALMIRRGAFDAVGGWSEAYFFYGEDAELCARLRDTETPLTYYVPDVTIAHLEGGSVASVPNWKALAANQGALLYVSRNRSTRALLAMRAAVLIGNAGRAALWLAMWPCAAAKGRGRQAWERSRTCGRIARLALAPVEAFSSKPPDKPTEDPAND